MPNEGALVSRGDADFKRTVAEQPLYSYWYWSVQEGSGCGKPATDPSSSLLNASWTTLHSLNGTLQFREKQLDSEPRKVLLFHRPTTPLHSRDPSLSATMPLTCTTTTQAFPDGRTITSTTTVWLPSNSAGSMTVSLTFGVGVATGAFPDAWPRHY